jgi:hypothetical protein
LRSTKSAGRNVKHSKARKGISAVGETAARKRRAEYKAGLDRAIANGWLVPHESGTFVRFTQAGADLFA